MESLSKSKNEAHVLLGLDDDYAAGGGPEVTDVVIKDFQISRDAIIEIIHRVLRAENQCAPTRNDVMASTYEEAMEKRVMQFCERVLDALMRHHLIPFSVREELGKIEFAICQFYLRDDNDVIVELRECFELYRMIKAELHRLLRAGIQSA